MRVAGLVLLMLGVAIAFWEASSREPRKLREAEGILLLLRHIRGQMSSFSLPLPAIYSSFSDPVLEKSGFLLLLREKGLSAALQSGMAFVPDKEIQALLSQFAEGLGRDFLAEQLSFCDYVMTVYTDHLDRYRQECPKKCRLHRSMVLLFGGMLLLFFW